MVQEMKVLTVDKGGGLVENGAAAIEGYRGDGLLYGSCPICRGYGRNSLHYVYIQRDKPFLVSYRNPETGEKTMDRLYGGHAARCSACGRFQLGPHRTVEQLLLDHDYFCVSGIHANLVRYSESHG